MSATTFYNSQPVDDYVRELTLREKEITRSRGIDNFKKEVPYKILLFLGYVAGICLLILCLFYGLKNLLIRYGVIYEAPISGTPVITSPYEPQSMNNDELIDVERILEQSNNNRRSSNQENEGNSFADDSANSASIDPENGHGSSIERPIRNDNQSSGNGSGGGGSSDQASNASIERPIRNDNQSPGNGSGGGGSSDQATNASIERPIRNDNQSPGSSSGGGGSSNQSSDQSCNCSNDFEESQSSTPTPVVAGLTDGSCETTLNPEPIEMDEPKRGSVRDYVIFDTTLFDGEYISELVIGRRYENPNAEANNSWCYSELMYASGLTKTLYLVQTKNGVLKPTEITHEIADKFGVPISEIHRAQRTCSI